MRNAILAVVLVLSLCGGLVRPALAQGNVPIPACTGDELSFINLYLSSLAQQVFSQIQDLRDRSPAELSQLNEELHRLQTMWRDSISLGLPYCSRAMVFRLDFERLLYESMLSVTLLQLGDTRLAEVYLDQLDSIRTDIQDELERLASASTTEPTVDPANEPTLRSTLFLDDESLLTGSPCAAPCWHGIMPGETPWEEAVEVITSDAFEGIDFSAEGGLQQLVWQKAGSGQYCCRLIADEYEGATISYIFLALSAPRITVGDVLEAHGEPLYVTTFPFTDSESVVQLIYPEVPMVVSALVGDPDASLAASSDVVAVLYMDQEEMDLIILTTELKAWNGYQSYSAYDQGTPVVTPIVTPTPAY